MTRSSSGQLLRQKKWIAQPFHYDQVGGGTIMTAADFAALFGTSPEEMKDPSSHDNFFYTEEDDDDEGAEWD